MAYALHGSGIQAKLNGAANNDTLMGRQGNDVLRGGMDEDIAAYFDLSEADASFALNPDGSLQVTLPDGVDTVNFDVETPAFGGGIDCLDIVSGIEVLEFSDGRIYL